MESPKISELVRDYPFLGCPVFIVGTGRCGTSTMQYLLDGHPELLVWPFEFPYYFIKDIMTTQGNQPFLVRELNNVFSESLDVFGGICDAGHGVSYSLGAVDPNCFKGILGSFESETVTRKDYFLLLVYAFQQSLVPNRRPSRFVVPLHEPCDEILVDFPDAKLIATIRNPMTTYAAIKEAYFMYNAAFPSSVYSPRAACRRFKWGLVETAFVPIIHTYAWYNSHKDYPNLLFVKLEDVVKNPSATMEQVAAFLDIEFSPSLLQKTVLGLPFALTYGQHDISRDSYDKLSLDALSGLSTYEGWWLYKHLGRFMDAQGYAPEIKIPQLSKVKRFMEVFVPLKNEFPHLGKNSQESMMWTLVRWVYTLVRSSWRNYIINRFLFITLHSDSNTSSRYPPPLVVRRFKKWRC